MPGAQKIHLFFWLIALLAAFVSIDPYGQRTSLRPELSVIASAPLVSLSLVIKSFNKQPGRIA